MPIAAALSGESPAASPGAVVASGAFLPPIGEHRRGALPAPIDVFP